MIPGSLHALMMGRGARPWQENPVRIAAVNQRYPGASMGGSNTTNRGGRIPFMIGSGTLMELIISLPTNSNGNDGDGSVSHPVNYTGLRVEDPVTGNLTTVRSNGLSEFTVPGLQAEYDCDPINYLQLGYPTGVPKGKVFWLRWDALQEPTHSMRAGYFVNMWDGASGWFWNQGSGNVLPLDGIGPRTKTGTVFGGQGTSTGGNAVEVWGPIVKGRFLESDALVTLSMGDSLYWGSNAVIPMTGFRGYGVPSRSSFEADGISDPIASLIIARSGNTADDLVTPHDKSWTYFKNVTKLSTCLGTNDMGVGGANSSASTYNNLLARLRLIWAAAKAGGVQDVSTIEYLPNATSINDYIDIAGQTFTPGWEPAGYVDQFIQRLYDEVVSNPNLDAVIGYDSIRYAENRRAWKGRPANSYHWGGENGGGQPDMHGSAAQELRAFWKRAVLL